MVTLKGNQVTVKYIGYFIAVCVVFFTLIVGWMAVNFQKEKAILKQLDEKNNSKN